MLAAIVAGAIALTGGDDDGGANPSRLTLEILDTQLPEPLVKGLTKDLAITFPDAELAAVEGLDPSVRSLRLSCSDLTGKAILMDRIRLPLTTDQGAVPAHGHAYMTEDTAVKLARCTITGAGLPPLAGRVES